MQISSENSGMNAFFYHLISTLPLIISNLGHFIIITIFIGSEWPMFSENTLMLYQ